MHSPGATSASAQQDRDLYANRDMSRLLKPSSVAVIGASPTPGSFGMGALQNICSGYSGKIFPINPKYDSILGHACYPSITDTPDVPDCAVLTIPRDHVLKSLEDCAKRGVGGAIIFSSGFSELGTPDAMRLQQDMSALARETGMKICGPNCIGIVNVGQRLGLTFMTRLPMIQGPIGVVSQSGGVGYLLMQGMERGIGFSHFLSPGNSCDVDVCDFVNYLVDDEDTKVIAVTLEGIRSGARLIEACRRALVANKPVIVCKMGSNELSRRVALSHTGTLTGSNEAYRAAFAQTGAIVVDHFEALLETAVFFSRVGSPQAKGIGVLTVSGGAAVMAADVAMEYGVDLPLSAPETTDKLRTIVPPFGSVHNPADLTAESLKTPDMYGYCITAYAEDPAFAAVVVPMMSAFKPTTVVRAEYLSDLAKKLGKPICVIWLNEWLEGPGSEIYDRSESICMFRSMSRCFATLKSWIDRYENRERLLTGRAAKLAGPSSREAARKIVKSSRSRHALSERESKQVLASYDIAVTREMHVSSIEDAVSAAAKIGYPVVMKAESGDIPRKTDAGLVKLNLRQQEDVRTAYKEIMQNVTRLPKPDVVQGIVIQEMIESGAEIMLGVRRDPQFGTLAKCSAGGVLVELIGDVAVALAPLDLPRAHELIRSLRGYRVLEGLRGVPAANIDALAEALCRLSELGCDLAEEIEEIEINPVILTTRSAVAVDALVVRRTG